LTRLYEINTTVASEEAARSIAKVLLEFRFAACIQVTGPIRSFYRWKDAIHDDEEWRLSIKTNCEGLDACLAELRRIHPYETPELLVAVIDTPSEDYKRWLVEQVGEPIPTTANETWHLRIAGYNPNAATGQPIVILGKPIESLELPTGPSPLTVSFEEVAESLSSFSNLHFEPDGSFVWGSSGRQSASDRDWQLDCMIYDRENRIEYVELKGNCNRETWDTLVKVLSGVDCTSLIVQWIEQGVWISESGFRKCID